jgi:atypical dual specificity phosphatase
MHRFYWLDEGRLAGCSRPGARPGRTGAADDLRDDLHELAAQGIGAVLTLTETPLPEEDVAAAGLVALHLPIVDFAAPGPVHCLAGQGRTGSILAATRIRAGATASEAIAAVRSVCPGAVESAEQVASLEAYARERSWLT